MNNELRTTNYEPCFSRYASRFTRYETNLLLSKAPAALERSKINQKRAIMQNKPNLLNAPMNVSQAYTKDYGNKSDWTLGENKPNSKPIKPKTKPIKPKTKPIQSQSNPNQTQFKPNQTQFLKVPDNLSLIIITDILRHKPFDFLNYFAMVLSQGWQKKA